MSNDVKVWHVFRSTFRRSFLHLQNQGNCKLWDFLYDVLYFYGLWFSMVESSHQPYFHRWKRRYVHPRKMVSLSSWWSSLARILRVSHIYVWRRSVRETWEWIFVSIDFRSKWRKRSWNASYVSFPVILGFMGLSSKHPSQSISIDMRLSSVSIPRKMWMDSRKYRSEICSSPIHDSGVALRKVSWPCSSTIISMYTGRKLPYSEDRISSGNPCHSCSSMRERRWSHVIRRHHTSARSRKMLILSSSLSGSHDFSHVKWWRKNRSSSM